MVRWLIPVVVLLGGISNAGAFPGDKRGYLSSTDAGGNRVLRAWIDTPSRGTLFYAIELDGVGAVTRICPEPSPVPAGALSRHPESMHATTTWVWDLLRAKGHGRLLVGFWDTAEGRRLARASERGEDRSRCD